MEDPNDEETFRLISQIVAGVRIHETEGGAFGSVLTQINRLTSRWQPTDETPTTTSQVMFALNPETSGWAAGTSCVQECSRPPDSGGSRCVSHP